MSFGQLFDGYCLIHASRLVPERRKWFGKELQRVGVNNYSIVNAVEIEDGDKRLENFCQQPKSGVQLSLALSLKMCIDIARRNQWKSLVILEDDIVFRQEMSQWWLEVEHEVCDAGWDLLFLYRWLNYSIESNESVHLIPIRGTLCTHCFVIRESAYTVYENALDHSIEIGKVLDKKYTHRYLNKHNVRIVATSKNLAGQKGGFRTTMTNRRRIASKDFKKTFGLVG